MSGYGRIFALWRDAAAPLWRDYTHHPFVEGLRDGTLPREAFLRYLVQDYVFLINFARAWALAVTKAETIEEMRTSVATVHALIEVEMPLHIETCAAEGLTERHLFEAEEAPANLAYTRHVLDAGHSGDLLDLMAALAPCVLGYGEIGARLSAEAEGGAFQEWIATYGGQEYQQVCNEVGVLIDGAAARRLGDDPAESPRWPRLCTRFATATRLEIGFWQMGLAG